MQSPHQIAKERFIQPEVLSRISNLELLARSVVEGFVGGLHRSPYKGFSVEFVEYRPYSPGDDPMHVDWKLYARTDRLFIKEFEDETNTSLQLLVDVSRSMDYSSHAVSKQQYAFYLAVSLAYFMVRQRDGVGLTLFDSDIVTRIPPKSTSAHLQLLISELQRSTTGGASALGKPLHALADTLTKRGFVVLISDLLGDEEELLEGIRHFRFKGCEVIVFHILDPVEVDFTFDKTLEFEDLETGQKLMLNARDVRSTYISRMEEFRGRIEKGCARLGADYHMIRTDKPLDFALFSYLAARRKRS